MAALVAGAAVGQSTDDINSSLQFNFANPGARSLGLAGAFVARADDATAVYANPAGLIQLGRPEVSIDTRSWEFSTPFLDTGSQESAGSFAGLGFDESSDSVGDLSFFSAFYPSRRGRWVAGISAHRVARFETEVHSDGAEVCCNSFGVRELARAIDGRYALDIETIGVSAALKVSSNLSLGATVSYATFDLESRTERLDAVRASAENPPPGLDREGDRLVCCEFGNSQFAVITFQTQVVDPDRDDDLTYNLGWLWQSTRERQGVPLWTVGGVYRRGPEFGFLGASFLRDARANPIVYRSLVSGPSSPDACKANGRAACPGIFKVPDVLGFGLSFRPNLAWVIAFEYNRVEYSDLLDATLDIVNADSVIARGARGRPADFLLDDGDELRLGVEYAVARERRLPDLFFRGGVWRDPDHKMRYVGADPERRSIWAPGDDEMHWAAGFGLRYPRFQLDIGADLSDRVDTVSLSAVFFLGRRWG